MNLQEIRQYVIGVSLGLSIVFSMLGFFNDSLRMQLLGLWLIAGVIVGVLGNIAVQLKHKE